MPTGLESAFDQQEGEDVFAVAEGAPTGVERPYDFESILGYDFDDLDLSEFSLAERGIHRDNRLYNEDVWDFWWQEGYAGTDSSDWDSLLEYVVGNAYSKMLADLENLGLTEDDVGGNVLEDYVIKGTPGRDAFKTITEPTRIAQRQEKRDNLLTLFSEDAAGFYEAYAQINDVNEKVNFLYSLYEKGDLNKEKYEELAIGEIVAADPEGTYFKDDGEYFRIDREHGRDANMGSSVVLYPEQHDYNRTRGEALLGQPVEEAFKLELGTTTGVRPYDDDSIWVQLRDNYLLPAAEIAATVVGGPMAALAVAGLKVANGETLKTGDYLNLAIAGLQQADILTPPGLEVLDEATGRYVPSTPGSGFTIGGKTYGYAESVNLLKSAVTGNPLSALVSFAGDTLLGDTLTEWGVPTELLSDPDFVAGLSTTIEKLENGEDPSDAFASGFASYIKEGGNILDLMPNLPTAGGEIDWSFADGIIDNLSDVWSDTGTMISAYVDPTLAAIGDLGTFAGNLWEPAIQAGQDVIEAGSEVVGDVSSAIGDVTDPITGAIGDAGSALDDTVRSAGSAVGDYLDPVWGFIGDNLVLTPAGAQAQQQQQRTPTQNLFDSELKSIGSISLSEYAPLLTGDQRRHAPVGTAANPARQQPQTAAESLLKPLSTQFAGQLAQDPVRQQMEKDRLASQGSLYGNFNSNPFASPFDTEEEEGLI
jgi:hypothetical protein